MADIGLGEISLSSADVFKGLNYIKMIPHIISILNRITVKILKTGTPEIITIIVVQLEQLDFTLQYCVQKMQTE